MTVETTGADTHEHRQRDRRTGNGGSVGDRAMKIPRRRRARPSVVAVLLFGAILIGGVLGVSAANSVPGTKANDQSRAIATDDLKPTPDCSGITVNTKVNGSGMVNGTSGADLITGGSGIDTISGQNGTDCILGGGGADAINGGNGTDVCIGGPGVDTFTNCETQTQ
jgi:Ca2+-binding RTX toxin-like protein